MKRLTVILLALSVMSLALIANAQACTLTLVKKTESAKTAAINGVNVNAKMLAALSSQCSIKYKVMSENERKALQIEQLKKRLEKLQASN